METKARTQYRCALSMDVLVEYGQHPYQSAFHAEQPAWRPQSSEPEPSAAPQLTRETAGFDHAFGDDLEMLGLGVGLAERGA